MGYFWGTTGLLMGYYSGTTGILLRYHWILLEFQRSNTRVLQEKHRNTSGVTLDSSLVLQEYYLGTIVSLLVFYRVPSWGTTMVLLGCYPGTTAGLLLVYYWLTWVLQNCTEVLLWYRCIGVLLGYYWTLGTTCALIGHCWVLLVHYCGITVVEKGSIGKHWRTFG